MCRHRIMRWQFARSGTRRGNLAQLRTRKTLRPVSAPGGSLRTEAQTKSAATPAAFANSSSATHTDHAVEPLRHSSREGQILECYLEPFGDTGSRSACSTGARPTSLPSAVNEEAIADGDVDHLRAGHPQFADAESRLQAHATAPAGFPDERFATQLRPWTSHARLAEPFGRSPDRSEAYRGSRSPSWRRIRPAPFAKSSTD